MKASLVTTVSVIHPDCIVGSKADGLRFFDQQSSTGGFINTDYVK